MNTLFPEIRKSGNQETQPAAMTPRVYSRRDRNTPADAVYVGRPSTWGNPFTMASEADRDRVCDEFEAYAIGRLRYEPDWLQPLKGKSLVCYCAPKRCHADTLLRLANQA